MNFPVMQFSEKVKTIPEALSVYINNVVYSMRRRGDSVLILSLGEAFFDVPMLPFELSDFKKGCHYSESRGMLELREIICQYYRSHYDVDVDPAREIIISAGSKPLIYMAFQSILDPGDEVLIHEPAWLSYPEEIKLADGVPVFVPYMCPVVDFEKYFSDKTRMVVLNNPNNPAGKVYGQQELMDLYRICRTRGIYILIDEAYSDFILDDSFCSMGRVVPDKDGIIIVNSLSKNLGISGWRIGYVISSASVAYNILKLNQHLITCAPTPLSLYLVRHFNDIIDATLPQAQDVVRKRIEIERYLKEIGLQSLEGAATFYLFVNIGSYKHSSLDLALHLLMKYHIAVVPGLAYGESTERFIRISVGTESINVLKRALDTIKLVIDHDEFDDCTVNRELSTLGMNRFTAKED